MPVYPEVMLRRKERVAKANPKLLSLASKRTDVHYAMLGFDHAVCANGAEWKLHLCPLRKVCKQDDVYLRPRTLYLNRITNNNEMVALSAI